MKTILRYIFLFWLFQSQYSKDCMIKIDTLKNFEKIKIQKDTNKYEEFLLSRIGYMLYYQNKFYDLDGDKCTFSDFKGFSSQRQTKPYFYFKHQTDLDKSFRTENCQGPEKFIQSLNFSKLNYYYKTNGVKSDDSDNLNQQLKGSQNDFIQYSSLDIGVTWNFYRNQKIQNTIQSLKGYPNIKGQYCLEFQKINIYNDIQAIQVYMKINRTKQNMHKSLKLKINTENNFEYNFQQIFKNIEYIVRLKFFNLQLEYSQHQELFQDNYIIFFPSKDFKNNQSFKYFLDLIFENYFGMSKTYKEDQFVLKNFINFLSQIVQNSDNNTINDLESIFIWKKIKQLLFQLYIKSNKVLNENQQQDRKNIMSEIENFIISNCSCLQASEIPGYYQFYNLQLLQKKFQPICFEQSKNNVKFEKLLYVEQKTQLKISQADELKILAKLKQIQSQHPKNIVINLIKIFAILIFYF